MDEQDTALNTLETEVIRLKVVLGAILELLNGDAFAESIVQVAVETLCRIHEINPETMRATYYAWSEKQWTSLRAVQVNLEEDESDEQ